MFVLGPALVAVLKKNKTIIFIDNLPARDTVQQVGKYCDYNFVPISSRLCKDIFFTFHVEDRHNVDRMTDYNYYEVIENYPVQRDQLYKFWLDCFVMEKKFNLLNGVLNSNWNFYSQQEMSRAARSADIPFIVLLKEGIGSPNGVDRMVAENKHTRLMINNHNDSSKVFKIRPGVYARDQIRLVFTQDYLVH